MEKEKVWNWVLREVEKGRASVSPAGTHVVPEPAYTFTQRLASCRDINELQGFAQRKRLNPSLPVWTLDERNAILRRKMEMQKQRMKK